MNSFDVIFIFLSLVAGCIIMWGFMLNAKMEVRNARWIPVRRRKPGVRLSNVLGKEKSVRVLCCRKNGDILIDAFDLEKGSFGIPDVEAWRPLPLSYHASIRQMMGLVGKIGKRGKNEI